MSGEAMPMIRREVRRPMSTFQARIGRILTRWENTFRDAQRRRRDEDAWVYWNVPSADERLMRRLALIAEYRVALTSSIQARNDAYIVAAYHTINQRDSPFFLNAFHTEIGAQVARITSGTAPAGTVLTVPFSEAVGAITAERDELKASNARLEDKNARLEKKCDDLEGTLKMFMDQFKGIDIAVLRRISQGASEEKKEHAPASSGALRTGATGSSTSSSVGRLDPQFIGAASHSSSAPGSLIGEKREVDAPALGYPLR